MGLERAGLTVSLAPAAFELGGSVCMPLVALSLCGGPWAGRGNASAEDKVYYVEKEIAMAG